MADVHFEFVSGSFWTGFGVGFQNGSRAVGCFSKLAGPLVEKMNEYVGGPGMDVEIDGIAFRSAGLNTSVLWLRFIGRSGMVPPRFTSQSSPTA